MEKNKIKDFTEVITGGTPSTSKIEFWENGNIPWLNSGELNQKIVTTSRNYITKLGLEKSSSRLMPKDTVLIALTGSTTGVVGYLTFEACANQSVTGILPSENHNSKYLYYYLNSIRPKVLSDAYGGAQPHISQGYVKELEIPIPPLTTQQKIAAILDQADALIQNNRAIVQKYDALTQSLFLDMFGDPVKNEKGWDKKKLGDFGIWKSGGTPSRRIEKYFQGTIPWISSGELNEIYIDKAKEYITDEAVKNTSTHLIEKGSLLLGMYDTAALKSSINTVELTCNQAIAFAKLNENVNTLYVYYVIQYGKEHYKSQQRGVRQKNLNLSMIKDLKISNPPITLQNQFAERVALIEAQKQLAQLELVKSEVLFNSLLQGAFKGELS